MKKFTVNDFCNYYTKCFCCGKSTEILLYSTKNSFRIKIEPIITNHSIHFDSKVSYHSSLKIEIVKLNNSFVTNDFSAMKDYLESRRFQLVSRCSICKADIFSNYLIFDFNKNIIKPFSILKENLVIKDSNGFTYYIDTDLSEKINKSYIEIYSTNNTPNFLDIKTEISAYPLYRWRSKENFIKKMQTFINFS